jgi:hypothetical protein
MEVWVTGYNFESWLCKDHSCHVCFKLAHWFQKKKNLNIFPIGSYVKTMSADSGHLGWRSGSQDTILNVDHLRTIHSWHVCFKFTYWFQRRRLLKKISIGSYVKTKSSHGSHLEFPIGKRFTSLVQDHPMIILAKSQFNWLGGFWQEDFLNFSQWEYIIHLAAMLDFKSAPKTQIW